MEKLRLEHKEIFQTILDIQPFDEIEEKELSETLLWVNSGAPIFRIQKPDIPNKHMCAYFVLWDRDAQKILLGDHKKSGLWLPPGGHVEPGENPRLTVQRECVEELNHEAEFYFEYPIFLTSTLTVGLTAGHTDISLWYVLKGVHTDRYGFDRGGVNSLRWFQLDEIPYNLSDRHMKRFVQKLQKMHEV